MLNDARTTRLMCQTSTNPVYYMMITSNSITSLTIPNNRRSTAITPRSTNRTIHIMPPTKTPSLVHQLQTTTTYITLPTIMVNILHVPESAHTARDYLHRQAAFLHSLSLISRFDHNFSYISIWRVASFFLLFSEKVYGT